MKAGRSNGVPSRTAAHLCSSREVFVATLPGGVEATIIAEMSSAASPLRTFSLFVKIALRRETSNAQPLPVYVQTAEGSRDLRLSDDEGVYVFVDNPHGLVELEGELPEPLSLARRGRFTRSGRGPKSAAGGFREGRRDSPWKVLLQEIFQMLADVYLPWLSVALHEVSCQDVHSPQVVPTSPYTPRRRDACAFASAQKSLFDGGVERPCFSPKPSRPNDSSNARSVVQACEDAILQSNSILGDGIATPDMLTPPVGQSSSRACTSGHLRINRPTNAHV